MCKWDLRRSGWSKGRGLATRTQPFPSLPRPRSLYKFALRDAFRPATATVYSYDYDYGGGCRYAPAESACRNYSANYSAGTSERPRSRIRQRYDEQLANAIGTIRRDDYSGSLPGNVCRSHLYPSFVLPVASLPRLPRSGSHRLSFRWE